MKIKELADKTRYFKETPEGVSIMCKAIEDMRNEAVMEAEKLKSYQIAWTIVNKVDRKIRKAIQIEQEIKGC